ncbi:MAG: hypothetical protein J3R72DRAFT_445908 [Linnemannia gamsii]|nr:MAG: hypothetical protein J3R72DRAFT_445908 [Linnemannia gamsii]
MGLVSNRVNARIVVVLLSITLTAVRGVLRSNIVRVIFVTLRLLLDPTVSLHHRSRSSLNVDIHSHGDISSVFLLLLQSLLLLLLGFRENAAVLGNVMVPNHMLDEFSLGVV